MSCAEPTDLSTQECNLCLILYIIFRLQAIATLGWSSPTLIQEKAIPLALEGKDILARARTGSGKTAAYAIPVIQHILQCKQVNLHGVVDVIDMDDF